MKSLRSVLSTAALGVVAALSMTSAAYAHEGGHRPHAFGAAHAFAVDPAARLAEFKAVLNLTPDQLPAWTTFEQTTLANAAQRTQILEAAKANGTPRAQVRDQMRAAREANKDQTMAARKALFASLNEEQRAAAKAHFQAKMAAFRHRAHTGT
jgi:hypothetical protein